MNRFVLSIFLLFFIFPVSAKSDVELTDFNLDIFSQEKAFDIENIVKKDTLKKSKGGKTKTASIICKLQKKNKNSSCLYIGKVVYGNYLGKSVYKSKACSLARGRATSHIPKGCATQCMPCKY